MKPRIFKRFLHGIWLFDVFTPQYSAMQSMYCVKSKLWAILQSGYAQVAVNSSNWPVQAYDCTWFVRKLIRRLGCLILSKLLLPLACSLLLLLVANKKKLLSWTTLLLRLQLLNTKFFSERVFKPAPHFAALPFSGSRVLC